MKLKIQLGDRMRDVEIAREGWRLSGTLDGQPLEADAVEVSPGIYSILRDGRAFEVRVERAAAGLTVVVGGQRVEARVVDPRQWQGRRGGAVEVEGRQQIVAPMPGKVVRVLVQQGEKVEAGRGLLVVEAMKMQNEIRSPKTGTVERLLVTEGQAVNAGEVVAVVG
ncbi:MAG TPA: biotin/lipoyl-containing protein [Candidatus Acidoferrales bacterium]|nr:biotin/lipoyl-containing protein [Candidatus Acidoferrales bacterium]